MTPRSAKLAYFNDEYYIKNMTFVNLAKEALGPQQSNLLISSFVFFGHVGTLRCRRKTLRIGETKSFIDWSDILFGQSDLMNSDQNGTP